MKRGRKPLTPEQRALTTKYKNIAVDTDLVAFIEATAVKLAAEFGFRPTVAQTVRHLLKKVKT